MTTKGKHRPRDGVPPQTVVFASPVMRTKQRRRGGSQEKRPVLFITFSYDDLDEASVLDVSGTYDDALANAIEGGWADGPIFIYRVERQKDGTYGIGRRVWSES